MERVLISLKPEELRTADRLAADLNVSRAEIFRRGLQALATGRNATGITPEEIERRKAVTRRLARWSKILSKDKSWDPMAITRAERDAPPRWMR